jgi:flagellin-like protein
MLLLSNFYKRGLSNVVAYVFLIGITISLAVMTYSFLTYYVDEGDIFECPNDVELIVESYECIEGTDGNLTITIKNRGKFNVDGYYLRVHNKSDPEFGFYLFDDGGSPLSPGERNKKIYDFSSEGVHNVTIADVRPFIVHDGKNYTCDSYFVQKINCV